MGKEEYIGKDILEEEQQEGKTHDIIIECPLDYSLSDNEGCSIGDGEARIAVYDENMILSPEFGEPFDISYRDIMEFSASKYKINILLDSGEKLVFSSMGYNYEDLARAISRCRNEMLIKDMLMKENVIIPGVEAEYESYNEKDELRDKGSCEIRLYDTAVIIIPQGDEPERLPYCIISEVKTGDYEIRLHLENKNKYRLYAMGREFEPFRKALSNAINSLASKSQSMLKILLPDTSSSIIRKASRLMAEGKAAKISDIESISPELWLQMEKRLESTDIYNEYIFLKSLSQKDKLCIGMKKGLMGDLTGEYIWFLVSIYSTDPKQPGNAVIMESSSGGGSGKATYVFRMMDSERYRRGMSIDELNSEADIFIRKLNYCMLSVNFRREPIYLPDEKLKDPKYAGYNAAVKKLESLRALRSHFIGRVIHSSYDKWKQDILGLLRSNV